MAENSKIEWTDHTFNPWIGCTKVSPQCTHCYAATLMDDRYHKVKWGPGGTRVVTSAAAWAKPRKWDRWAAEGVCYRCEGKGKVKVRIGGEAFERICSACAGGMGRVEPYRARVFCASLADVFEDWDGAMLNAKGRRLWRNPHPLAFDDWIDVEHSPQGVERIGVTMADVRRRLFALIDATPHLDWLLVTKRPENIRRMWPRGERQDRYTDGSWARSVSVGPLYKPNVWLLTSVGDQPTYDVQSRHLETCRDLVPVLGFSGEPMLGPIQFRPRDYMDDDHPASYKFDWWIVGGESGHGARPMHPAWARSLRDHCQAAGVPFFFKQWGEWAPLEVCAKPAAAWSPCGVDKTHLFDDREPVFRIGKKAAGRLLDGREWNEYPRLTEAAT